MVFICPKINFPLGFIFAFWSLLRPCSGIDLPQKTDYFRTSGFDAGYRFCDICFAGHEIQTVPRLSHFRQYSLSNRVHLCASSVLFCFRVYRPISDISALGC